MATELIDTARNAIPRMSQGLHLLANSLKARTPLIRPLDNEPDWDGAYFNSNLCGPQTVVRDLQTFGYDRTEIRTHSSYKDLLGFVGPIRPLTDTGIQRMYWVAQRLEDRAPVNVHIVTKRLRRVDAYSRFIREFAYNPDLLFYLSQLAGVPLIPHPHRDAAIQINYYSASVDRQNPRQIAKWHTDGMDYVLTVLLSEGTHEGGQFLYFDGTRDQFRSADSVNDNRIRVADFNKQGEAIFTRGSRIYHGVTPVTKGHRITLVVSLFCPFFARYDSNRFWHSAPDDGFFRTIANWLSFRMPWQTPDYFLRRFESHIQKSK